MLATKWNFQLGILKTVNIFKMGSAVIEKYQLEHEPGTRHVVCSRLEVAGDATSAIGVTQCKNYCKF